MILEVVARTIITVDTSMDTRRHENRTSCVCDVTLKKFNVLLHFGCMNYKMELIS